MANVKPETVGITIENLETVGIRDNKQETVGAPEEAPIHGDILEAVLSHVPLIDLVSACLVSKSWKRAVASSLRHLNGGGKPWLIVHSQSLRSASAATSAAAYDPRSQLWIGIHRPSVKYSSGILRSSHSTLLYVLSPFKFSFSFGPLHLHWYRAEAPLVWRSDPIVAKVCRRIIVAGGECDFSDDPLAVEIYDMKTRKWETSDFMPAVFKDCSASVCLSIAVDEHKMYVTEKSSGETYTFNPITKTWLGPYNLRPNQNVFISIIGFSNKSLILVGLIGDDHDPEHVKGIKIWEVSGDLLNCTEIGQMPLEMVEKLGGESCSVSEIGASVMGEYVYIHNAWAAEEVVVWEVGVGGTCRWRSVQNGRSGSTERLVFTCSSVGMGDLQRALTVEDLSFAVKGRG